jgi:hypothetical protein
MKYKVDPAGYVNELGDICSNQVEVVVTHEVGDVVGGTGDEIVEAQNLVLLGEQSLAQV